MSHYYDFGTGDITKTIDTYQLWKQTYPRDLVPLNNHALKYSQLGQHDKALVESQAALRLDPKDRFAYQNLAQAFMGLGRVEEAKAIAQQAVTQKLDSWSSHFFLYTIAVMQGDSAAAEREVKWGLGSTPDSQSWTLWMQGVAAASAGKLNRARDFYRQAVDVARRANLAEGALFVTADKALLEAEFGNLRQAREQAGTVLAGTPGQEAAPEAALALALAGDTTRAQATIDGLVQRYPQNTLLNATFVATTRAAIEMDHRNPGKAVEILKAATPYELGMPIAPLPGHAVYVRGLAYLQAKQGAQAAAEFQKILDHRAITGFTQFYPLAHLGLARAYALSNDKAKARTAYQDFLALWKDADPDIPILRQAKAEYARL